MASLVVSGGPYTLGISRSMLTRCGHKSFNHVDLAVLVRLYVRLIQMKFRIGVLYLEFEQYI